MRLSLLVASASRSLRIFCVQDPGSGVAVAPGSTVQADRFRVALGKTAGGLQAVGEFSCIAEGCGGDDTLPVVASLVGADPELWAHLDSKLWGADGAWAAGLVAGSCPGRAGEAVLVRARGRRSVQCEAFAMGRRSEALLTMVLELQ